MSIRIILSQARHIGFNMDSILKPISSSTVYKKEHTKKTTRQIIARLSFLFFSLVPSYYFRCRKDRQPLYEGCSNPVFLYRKRVLTL